MTEESNPNSKMTFQKLLTSRHYLEVGVKKPLEETHVLVSVHRSHGPAAGAVLAPDLLVLGRHGRVLHTPASRHEHSALHDGPVAQVDEVPSGDDPAPGLRTHLDTSVREMRGLETVTW